MNSDAIELPVLRDDQLKIIQHPAKRKYLCAGRRWGKTVLGGTAGVHLANIGYPVAWNVPEYKNGRALWRWVNQVCAPHIKRGVDISQSERVVMFPSGGMLAMYSMDNADSIRSEKFFLVINDEAAKMKEEAIFDAVEPTLADFDGYELNIGTPKGLNWFANEFKNAQADLTGYSAAWRAPTSDNPNPNIQRAFARARERLPERTFHQEWLAEFVQGGVLFRNVRELATLTPQEPQGGHAYIIGADWARTTDYSVFAVLDRETRALVYLDRFTGVDYPTQLMRLEALSRRYNGAQIVAETNAMGKPMTEFAAGRSLPIREFATTQDSKIEIIDALIRAFEFREIKILNDATLINELESYEELKRTSNGKPVYGAPEGLHDDTVMALAFAWHGLSGGFSVLFEA